MILTLMINFETLYFTFLTIYKEFKEDIIESLFGFDFFDLTHKITIYYCRAMIPRD